MKMLTIVTNGALAILTIVLIFDKGFPQPNEGEFWMVLLAVGAPTITLYFLLFSSAPRREGWLSLYMQRKAAEEKKRIRDLEQGE